MSNWRATYARRFNERMGLDRPRPFDIKAYYEWDDDNTATAETLQLRRLFQALSRTRP